ncbi:TolC family protein [Magnetospirillum moscoviense]|nr:TolC family protein [Magnetospirillum moscoviense]MBF0323572.1 TolC family protein [Alphaproteobacteria bacterium]
MSVQSIRSLLLASGAMVAVLLAFAPASDAQTLLDELRTANENHPKLQSKRNAVGSSTEGIGVARSGYLPTVKVTGDSGPEYVDSPTRRTTEGHRYYKGRETAGITVTQKIFDGFSTDAQVDQAKAAKAMAEADLRVARKMVFSEGMSAYVEVLRYHKMIQLARESERKIAEQQNLEDERVQKGSGIAADVLAAKQRLQVAKVRRLAYERDFQVYASIFAQNFGHAPEVSKMSDPPIPATVLPIELESALRAAEDESPMVETASFKIESLSEQKRVMEAGYFPTLDLIGKANYENDKNATLGVRRDWSLLLTATWELFSGFKTDSQVAQATFNATAAKDDHLDAMRTVANEVRSAWHKLNNAKESLDLQDNAAILAEEVWEAKKKQRDAGKATVQEVLDEENAIILAQIERTQAYYNIIKHSYELLAGIGRLELPVIEQAATLPPQYPGRMAVPTARDLNRQQSGASSLAAVPVSAHKDEAEGVRSRMSDLLRQSDQSAARKGQR